MNGGDQKAIERCQQYQRDECENGRGEDVENLFIQIIFAEVGLIGIDVIHLKMNNIILSSISFITLSSKHLSSQKNKNLCHRQSMKINSVH